MEMMKMRKVLLKFFGAMFVGLFVMIASGIEARADGEVVYYSDLKDYYNFSFYTTSDSYCTVGGKGNLSGDIVLPASVIVRAGDGVSSVQGNEPPKTYKVKTVGNFQNNTAITSVRFSEGIEEISGSAFLNCTGLTGDVTIPDSVKTLGSQAFRGCKNLKGKLTLGKGLTKIQDSTFFSMWLHRSTGDT